MNDTRRAVLSALREGPASGPELAERTGVSRAAVWKHVEALRDAGFRVESGADGYRLVDVPEYGGLAVACGLEAPFEVEYHETLASTNDRARDLAAAGREDVAVIAERQTGGRGRLDREWASPPGGVWLSLVLRPALPPAHVPLLTLAAAVATTRAVRSVDSPLVETADAGGPDGPAVGIKWPNDVMVAGEAGERKLAGILTEMEGEADRVEWVVVGIGVNANLDAEALPAGATSLRELAGDVDRAAFVRRLLAAFDDLRSDPEEILGAWTEDALTLGRRVRVETPAGTVTGEAVDVERPGRLVVDAPEGRRRVHAGDCEHLRPAGETRAER